MIYALKLTWGGSMEKKKSKKIFHQKSKGVPLEKFGIFDPPKKKGKILTIDISHSRALVNIVALIQNIIKLGS